MEENLLRLRKAFDNCKTQEAIFSLDVSYMRKDNDNRNPNACPIMGEGNKIIGIAIEHFILVSSWAEYYECFIPDGETMVQKKNRNIVPSFWIKKRW